MVRRNKSLVPFSTGSKGLLQNSDPTQEKKYNLRDKLWVSDLPIWFRICYFAYLGFFALLAVVSIIVPQSFNPAVMVWFSLYTLVSLVAFNHYRDRYQKLSMPKSPAEIERY